MGATEEHNLYNLTQIILNEAIIVVDIIKLAAVSRPLLKKRDYAFVHIDYNYSRMQELD